MWKYFLSVLFGLFVLPQCLVAETAGDANFIPVAQIRSTATDNTECATGIFAASLHDTVGTVSESDDEIKIQEWVYANFYRADVLERVLACPEFANTPDTQTIRFMPIEYTFPGGRKITINYETQPKVLKQRILLATRPHLPDGPVSPDIMNDDTAFWANTNPAWYGIMVVQSGALSEFVGAGRNNVVSLKYITDNIADLYPRDVGRGDCTSRSGSEWTGGNDNDMVNRAVHKTVGLEKDSNDYYVAGDINLQWLSYMEIALDVAITVVTFGGGAVASGATKATRASKSSKNLVKSWKELRQVDSVKKYTETVAKSGKVVRELETIDKVKDAEKYAKMLAESQKLGKEIAELEKVDKAVQQYREVSKSISELQKYTRAFRNLKRAKSGNIASRAWKFIKASRGSDKMIARTARVARSSMKSGRTKDWLFQSTMRNAGRVARLERDMSGLYAIIHFGLDMYDWTETSNDEYTSGIDFKPFLLLSADDIQGSENVINYGMWLLWAGDYTNAADDDAAFLQAMDFAEKFHQDLTEIQDDEDNVACDVDIYVVRPIIRNPGEKDASLYYLFMNETPWTTHK